MWCVCGETGRAHPHEWLLTCLSACPIYVFLRIIFYTSHANPGENAKDSLSDLLAVKCWISFTELSTCHSYQEDFLDLTQRQVTL